MKKNINQFIQKFKRLSLLINTLLSKVSSFYKFIKIGNLNLKILNLKHLTIKSLYKFKFFSLTKLNLKFAALAHLFNRPFKKPKFYDFKHINLKISNFNKFLILFITILFGYLFYLTIPNIYDKLWVQQTVEKKLIEEFNVDFNLSSEISYVILPSPHFLIKNATVVDRQNSEIQKIAEIKRLKVFISQKNLFIKENLKINKVTVERANFLIKKDNISYITNFINQKFSLKNLDIKKSNLFLKDSNDDTLLINKIDSAKVFYSAKKLQNIIILKGELFNIPFLLNLNNDLINNEIFINTESKKLKLKINNYLNKKNAIKKGSTEISFLNTKLFHKYTIKDKNFKFKSQNSTLPNNIVNYNGQINLEPFNFDLVIDIEKIDLLKIINKESIIMELIKSEVFFNENINLLISLKSQIIQNHKILKNMLINLNVDQGKINLDKSKLKLNKMGSLELMRSNINFIDGELILNGEFIIKLDDSKKFFQFLQTPKKNRNKIEEININFDLNVQKNVLRLNSIFIDEVEPNDEVYGLISNFNSQNNIFKNVIEFKNFINRVLIAYEG